MSNRYPCVKGYRVPLVSYHANLLCGMYFRWAICLRHQNQLKNQVEKVEYTMKNYQVSKFDILEPKNSIKKGVNTHLKGLDDPRVVVTIRGEWSLVFEGKCDFDVCISVKNGTELLRTYCYKSASSDAHYMDVAHCENNILFKLWDEQNALYTWAQENFGRRANVYLDREMVYA